MNEGQITDTVIAPPPPPFLLARAASLSLKTAVSSPHVVTHTHTHQKFLRCGVSGGVQQKLTVCCETPCSTVTQFGLAWWAVQAQILQAPCLQLPE